ncbi:CerR family C-terminal domain-containing protein [uncultured Hoeflea sp.]|uniref:CerR family C-terminal domain-containing protein n=1 Tax=uncultured Hoeflea sp. TaxID=538666 RepID=UPI0026127021|nr:CerR family C-terminal domain-containing protein [uncultured Hoeflea sp.]
MSMSLPADENPDEGTTKADLIRAALKHFGEHGYDAASLRSIVSDALQNISSIKYHFGSKKGLYDACVVAVARRMRSEGPGEMLDLLANDPHNLTPEEARSTIRIIIGTAIRDALRPGSRSDTKFMRREVLMGGRGVDLFLKEVLRGHIDVMAALLSRAENLPPESSAARLRALGIIGQTTFFLTADILTKKSMGWDRFDDRVPELIDAIYPIQRNLKALL